MVVAGSAPSLGVVADPTRARILELIRDAPERRVLVGEVAERLGLRQPTISHHMAALLAEGIVLRERDGRRVWYSLHPDQEQRVVALLGEVSSPAVEADWERVIDDLAARYQGRFGRETVAKYLTDSRRLLAAARSEDAPLAASRTAAFASDRLDDLACGHPPSAGGRPRGGPHGRIRTCRHGAPGDRGRTGRDRCVRRCGVSQTPH